MLAHRTITAAKKSTYTILARSPAGQVQSPPLKPVVSLLASYVYYCRINEIDDLSMLGFCIVKLGFQYTHATSQRLKER